MDKNNFSYQIERTRQINKITALLKFKTNQLKETYKNKTSGKEQLNILGYSINIYLNKNSFKIYMASSMNEDDAQLIKIEAEKLFNRKGHLIQTVNDYVIPKDFYYKNDGLYAIKEKNEKNADGKYEKIKYKVKISDKWLFVTSDVYSEEYNIHQYEVMSCIPGDSGEKTGKIELCSKDTLNKRNLVIGFLANKLNCNVDEEYRNQYTNFFFNFICENKKHFIKKNTVPTLGWDENFKNFSPYSENLHIDYSKDNYNYFRTMIKGFEARGDKEEFVARMLLHGKNSFADFAISSAFAAPLLKMLGIRSFLINYYGPSKNQKSLSARIGLSAFGDMALLEMSGQDTVNVIKSKIHKMQNNFCYIDEIIQKGNKNKMPIINGYDIGNERDRHRLDQHAEIKSTKAWRTIAFCTSESSISNDNDMAGEINRTLVLESDCRPAFVKNDLTQHDYARDYYRFLSNNHGLLGKEYISNLIKVGPEILLKYYEKIDKALSEKNQNINLTDHISSISVICLANYLYRKMFCMIDDISYSCNLGIKILSSISPLEELNPLNKALNDVYTFFETNKASFLIENNSTEEAPSRYNISQVYGKIKNKEIYFIIGPLKKYMEECGWNWNIRTQLLSSGMAGYKAKSINNVVGKRFIIPLNRANLIEEEISDNERESIINENILPLKKEISQSNKKVNV